MSWHFSRALVAEYSAGNSLDGEPFARWKSLPFAPDDSCSDKMKGTCHRSPFGTMFVPSTANHGAELLTWFREASRVRTSAQRVAASGSLVLAPDFGPKWHGSSVKLHPDGSWSKIPHYSLLVVSEPFCETWPKWGTMRSGECWERSTPERHTRGTASGLWPTVTANCSTGAGHQGRQGGLNLQTAVKREMFPTPLVGGTGKSCHGQISGRFRAAMAPHLATPTARDWKSGTGAQERPGHAPHLSSQIGGQLNPDWVEWLMGWPIGWTACEPLETGKSQQWPLWHSGNCPPDCRIEARE